jgi:beta-xylosidase
MPDPHALAAEGRYWVYATESAGVNVQVAVSDDLKHWEHLGDAMPDLPAWVEPSHTWATKVIRHGRGYLAYFSARHAVMDRQAIGVAYSDTPQGPFRACPLPLIVGFIDADVARDNDGGLVLFYASGCDEVPAAIRAQRLTPDGLSLFGDAVTALDGYAARGNVVEAPTVTKYDNTWVMLYSVDAFSSDRYHVRYATAPNVMGPYTPQGAVLASNDECDGPGHADILPTLQGDYMVYHAWHKGQIGYGRGHYRALGVARLGWDGARPVVGDRP